MKPSCLILGCVVFLGACDRSGRSENPPPQRSVSLSGGNSDTRFGELQAEVTALRTQVSDLRTRLDALESRSGPRPATARLEVGPFGATNPAADSDAADIPGFEGVPTPIDGHPLTPEQRDMILADHVTFRPGPLFSSDVPVPEDAPLESGQTIQVRWGSTWWAGIISGIEPDGLVRVRYFGWGDYPEVIVPRSDLQLDPLAREKAVDSHFPPP